MDDVLTGLAEHLLLCIAEELAQCAIDLEEPAVKRDERHANWSVVEGTTESLFAILQCRHSCVPLRDVPNCRDHCHPLAVADEEVSAGLDNPLITVAMLNPGLVARRRVRGGKDGPVLRLRRSPRRLRKDDGEAAADDLLRDEPIERAVGGIDGQHDPLRIGECHRLRGRLPDGPEALLTLAQRGLDRMPLGCDGWLATVGTIDRGERFVGADLTLLGSIVDSVRRTQVEPWSMSAWDDGNSTPATRASIPDSRTSAAACATRTMSGTRRAEAKG